MERVAASVLHELAAFSEARASARTVVLCFADVRYAEVVRNWHAHLDAIGIDESVIVGFDRQTVGAMSVGKMRAAAFGRPLAEAEGGGAFEPRSARHQTLWFLRWSAIRCILQRNITVVHSDADAVWMRNPLPALAGVRADIIASHGQSNMEWLLCMGWILLRPTASGQAFVDSFVRHLERATKRRRLEATSSSTNQTEDDAKLAAFSDDQLAFNSLLTYGHGVQWPPSVWSCTNAAMHDQLPCATDRQSPLHSATPHESNLYRPCRDVLYVRTGRITIALLPQRLIRRHGCYQAHATCFRQSGARFRSRFVGEPLAAHEVSGAGVTPRAGEEAVLHCRHIDLLSLHQFTVPTVKALALDRLGLWRLGQSSIARVGRASVDSPSYLVKGGSDSHADSDQYSRHPLQACRSIGAAPARIHCTRLVSQLVGRLEVDRSRFLEAITNAAHSWGPGAVMRLGREFTHRGQPCTRLPGVAAAVCCPKSCKQCGGAKCAIRKRGKDDCCMKKIFQPDRPCCRDASGTPLCCFRV